MPQYKPADMHAYVVTVFEAMGSETREATLVADQLIEANLTGHDSHGIGMMPAYVEINAAGELLVNQHVSVVQDSGPILVLDGNRGAGQVMAREAMEMGIERAREHGLALVGLRNSSHIGRIGHWGEQCAAAGMASVHFVNAMGHNPLVAPYGGREARFVTNPICIAIPGSDGQPAVLLDMATSKIAMGKARVANNQGVPVPDGSIIDADGALTTDASAMFDPDNRGALVTFGDHKGSGLAIMAELLGAALIGGETSQPGNRRVERIINNMLALIVDPDAMGGRSHLATEGGAFLEYVRSSAPAQGFDEVLLPGMPEQRNRIARAAAIEVDDTTVAELVTAATAVDAPATPFA